MRGLWCVLLCAAALPVSAQQLVRGRVLDAVLQVPVAGAQLRLSGREAGFTDADGRFQLTLAGSTRFDLQVERLGYRTLHRAVGSGMDGELTLRLVPAAELHDALVVTAARRAQRMADAPVATQLITRRDIEDTGASDVGSVLFERTGIELEGGHPAGAGAMLQGFGTERVLILLDGQPLPGRIAGTFDLSRLPAAMLERVEVVKGPQSTLFGSAALGGVINLITRKPGESLSASGELLGGSEGRLDGSGRVHGHLRGIALLAEGGRRSISALPGRAEIGGAATERWDGLLKAAVSSARGNLELSGLLVDGRQQWASGQLFNFADNQQLALRAHGHWQFGTQRISPSLHWSDFEHLSRRSNSENPPAEGEAETQRIVQAEVLYSATWGAHTADTGIELRRESIESGRVIGESRSLDRAEGFAQYTWQRGQLSVVPGVRLSHSAAWGNHWTPRLAVLYRPTEVLALRASGGSAFRAPEFKELYMRFANVTPGLSYLVRGNPDLQPETSRNVSLGAELMRGAWFVRLQAFYNQFDQFIETSLAGDSSEFSVFSYGNIQDGVTQGAELEAGGQWRNARFEAGFSMLDARDQSTNQQLLGRPRHSGRASIAYSFDFGLRANLAGLYTGSTPLQRDSAQTLTRAAFTRIDLRVAQRLAPQVEFSFGIDNLFNKTPAQWPGFTGRQLYGGFAWQLGTPVR